MEKEFTPGPRMMHIGRRSLSKPQVDSAREEFNIKHFIPLKGRLAAAATNISPTANYYELRDLAERIVSLAVSIGITHIHATGDPALIHHLYTVSTRVGLTFVQSTVERVMPDKSTGMVATTRYPEYKHIMWRVWQ